MKSFAAILWIQIYLTLKHEQKSYNDSHQDSYVKDVEADYTKWTFGESIH